MLANLKLLFYSLLLVRPSHSAVRVELQFLEVINPQCRDCELYVDTLRVEDEEKNILYEISDTRIRSHEYIPDSEIAADELKGTVRVDVASGQGISILVLIRDRGDSEIDKLAVDTPLYLKDIYAAAPWITENLLLNTIEIKFRYRVMGCSEHFSGSKCDTCAQDYYTRTCNVHCVEVPGNYTCDPDTGARHCRTGLAGAECTECAPDFYPKDSCVVYCVPQHDVYTCSDTGARICAGNREGWDCERCKAPYRGPGCNKTCDEGAGYTCSRTGEKECREGWYPEGECTVHCTPVQDHYTCNTTTGYRICEPGRKGVSCEMRKCDPHYYGAECERYCKPTSHYTCSNDGYKLCVDHTTSVANDCTKQIQVLVMVVSGVGGIVLITLICSTSVICRRKIQGGEGGGREEGGEGEVSFRVEGGYAVSIVQSRGGLDDSFYSSLPSKDQDDIGHYDTPPTKERSDTISLESEEHDYSEIHSHIYDRLENIEK